MKRNIRSAYDDKLRIGISFAPVGRVDPQFQNETDINYIMAKFAKTGILPTQNRAERYGTQTGTDLREALELVTRAEQSFSELPAKVRDKFKNNPGAFLDFVQDDANLPQMAELGLLTPEATILHKAAPAAPPAASPPPTPPPESSGGE